MLLDVSLTWWGTMVTLHITSSQSRVSYFLIRPLLCPIVFSFDLLLVAVPQNRTEILTDYEPGGFPISLPAIMYGGCGRDRTYPPEGHRVTAG